ncbi:MAG: aminotransferase class V-fold PLP-dependent enzyme, partial [Sediminibacterium sp.]|nr:aminotransferase class V-fold PLP-dependent enzyme [Sediminibacterium sp.]
MKIHNFNSGPAILPPIVIENTQKALVNFNDSNLSILEIGHRTDKFKQVINEAQQLVKKIMEIDDNYEVLFLTGGATTQFMQIPLNILDENETAGYVVNGIWGKKAAEEASLFGQIELISNTADKNHTYIETDLKIPTNIKYIHITTNNTVEGTQWHNFPTFNIPVVADMSSDIFSKKIQFNNFDLIYAGAQKNLGAAGVT